LAEKKGTTKKTTAKKAATKKKNSEHIENERLKEQIRTLKNQRDPESTLSYQLMPVVLVFVALFFSICYIIPDKMGVLEVISYIMYGLFSHGAWLVPVCLILMARNWKSDYINNNVSAKTALCFGFIVSFASFCQLWTNAFSAEKEFLFNPAKLYDLGFDGKGGGVFGGLIANTLEKFTGVGSWIIVIFAVVLFGFASFGMTPVDLAVYIKNKVKEFVYNVNLERQRRLEESIELQKEEQSRRVEEANERSRNEEAKDALNIRKRRAFLQGVDENDGIDDETVIKEDIIPELSPDDTVPPTNGEPLGNILNIDAYNSAKADVQGKSVSLDDFGDNTENLLAHTEEAHGSDISNIFTDNASIAIAGVEADAGVINEDGTISKDKLSERVSENGELLDEEKTSVHVEPEPKPEEVYCFPPINFLHKDPNPLTFSVTDELKQTSIKLVETLKNFGVKTKIMNICCGPTVTRYELQPEIGVRVRSIANLSDDIALHLAAAGVRIEAPIPGKDAVGIEIPNKTVSIVYLRNLIENQMFESQKSKLTVCMGMDVAGSPIYMNIAKMPHLLIAGATGMGKSVCINSFIVSLLYKARPDEVKLILIDPKKVEFGVYNGLPHLLVPVVSDPKKAAGSLAWAVNEMERRFLLIEEVGVRDLDSYNEVTKDDPEKEYLPKIVIIIDELADLMMTARDEVENSICRIAQKARAAGMHLIIGTQRPSVDVITGLIKANVPSRVACTVASQVDSRTIIDVSGAEKLLGRGDMLYAPVGCMKPMRVQGAFVTDKEIENIVEFLKNGKTYEYDREVIESIEREAARCGEKKKGRGSSDIDSYDGGEDRSSILASDDAIFPAMEIAVDSGSISTSLLQRKLSLGYSRAARIVDKLEKLGVVGPFEGSKPRKVLITREEYLEMRMNYEDGE